MPAVAQCGTLSTHTTAPAGRLVFLDYLRIFAFASVFAGHKFSAPVQAAAREGVGWQAAAARVLWPFIEGGGAGVVVFFLVSGYIITHVLQRERTPEFLLKRAGFEITTVVPGPPLPLDSASLAQRYHLTPEQVLAIRDELEREFGTERNVFRPEPEGFKSWLHYHIFTCRAI